ncbi:uncharacterized protein METZ01_LOCUS509417, partial [marine metagenome]
MNPLPPQVKQPISVAPPVPLQTGHFRVAVDKSPSCWL